MKKMINNFEEYFLAVSLVIMVAINFGNVLSRYFIHTSWAFTEELLVILFVWNTMLASAMAFKHGAHLGLSVLTDLFPERFQKYVVVFGAVITIGLMALLARYGVDMVANQIKYNQKTPAMDLPEWIAGISISFGAIVIILRVIQATVLDLKQKKIKMQLKEGGK
ncbi:MAG TPA: TRAP transporter small permease [Clostridia bacterium]|nr:TRAP transporter small permease [Clostridia bacterium]